MKCYQAKADELAKTWYVIDATEMVVGRLAAQIAPILMGKHRPTYTPHIDTGDYVIVTNVDKVVFTGNKWQQKSYQRYSGHPGGQKDEIAWKLFQRHPDRILQLAVQRMMPKNKIGRHMLGKMKLYVGGQHPHQAQSPIPMEALSGRPAPSGAIYRPEPTPKVKTPRAKPTPTEAAPADGPSIPLIETPTPTPAVETHTPAPAVDAVHETHAPTVDATHETHAPAVDAVHETPAASHDETTPPPAV